MFSQREELIMNKTTTTLEFEMRKILGIMNIQQTKNGGEGVPTLTCKNIKYQ